MSFINPTSRKQRMLPSSIDEYVSSDNIARFMMEICEVGKILYSKAKKEKLHDYTFSFLVVP